MYEQPEIRRHLRHVLSAAPDAHEDRPNDCAHVPFLQNFCSTLDAAPSAGSSPTIPAQWAETHVRRRHVSILHACVARMEAALLPEVREHALLRRVAPPCAVTPTAPHSTDMHDEQSKRELRSLNVGEWRWGYAVLHAVEGEAAWQWGYAVLHAVGGEAAWRSMHELRLPTLCS